MHLLRPALVAGVLAAVCGLAMGAPISLRSRVDIPGPELASVSDSPVETRLMSDLEFPEVPEAVFADILQAPNRVATEFRTAAPVRAKDKDERVPEPPTALTFTAAVVFGGSVLVLRGKIRKQGHRPFRQRVRRAWQLMA